MSDLYDLDLGSQLTGSLHMYNLTTSNCTDGVQWIYAVFQQCVLDTRRYIAVICGIVSIIAWALNGLPQMIENFKGGRAHEAMSLFLLLFWTLGDTLNLVGCLMTRQLPLQKYMAVLSIMVDCFLLFQWFAALARDRRLKRSIRLDVNEATPVITVTAPAVNDDDDGQRRADSDRREAGRGQHLAQALACTFSLWLVTGAGCYWNFQSHLLPQRLPAPGTGRRLLFYQPVFVNTEDVVGYILGCMSSCCYLSSRVPQLAKNCVRRSTVGLSAGLFLLAGVGNATYGAQIFLTDDTFLFIIRHFPWILGSLGVLAMDLVIMLQFFAFRKRTRTLSMMAQSGEDTQQLLYS